MERRLLWNVTKIHLAIQGIIDLKFDKNQIFFSEDWITTIIIQWYKEWTPTIVETPIILQPQINLVTIQ